MGWVEVVVVEQRRKLRRRCCVVAPTSRRVFPYHHHLHRCVAATGTILSTTTTAMSSSNTKGRLSTSNGRLCDGKLPFEGREEIFAVLSSWLGDKNAIPLEWKKELDNMSVLQGNYTSIITC